ncbi:MAG: hypothetical protein AAB691_01985 [Patescibacteria group bacterium]
MRHARWLLILGLFVPILALASRVQGGQSICEYLERVPDMSPFCDYTVELAEPLDPTSTCRELQCDPATKRCLVYSSCTHDTATECFSVIVDGLEGACTADGHPIIEVASCPNSSIVGMFPKMVNPHAVCAR